MAFRKGHSSFLPHPLYTSGTKEPWQARADEWRRRRGEEKKKEKRKKEED